MERISQSQELPPESKKVQQQLLDIGTTASISVVPTLNNAPSSLADEPIRTNHTVQDIAIIVLNWNNPNATLACLNSIVAEISSNRDRCRGRIYIVDNGSLDDSVQRILGWLSENNELEAHFIQNPQNLGFAGGMNTGFEAVEANGPARYYWLLNNDLTLRSGALSALLDAISAAPLVAIWGPTVVHEESDIIQCAGGGRYSRLLGVERKHLRGHPLQEVSRCHQPGHFDFIYGAAMCIRGDFLRANKGLDDSYFLYYEELELARRLGKEDKLDWCIGSIVSHQGSDAAVRGKARRANTSYFAAYSACQYTWRHHRAFLLPVMLVRIAGLAVLAIKEANPGLALAPWRAIANFLRRRTPNPPQA